MNWAITTRSQAVTTRKVIPIAPSTSQELREDSAKELREDGTVELRDG